MTNFICFFHIYVFISAASTKVSSSDILQVSLELFDLDENRAAPGDIIYNKQSSTTTSSTQDNSPEP